MPPIRINHPTPSKRAGPPTRPKPNRDNKDKEPVEVYCRLRPLNNISDLLAVHRVVTNPSIVRLSPPNGSRGELFYKFKHVFGEYTSQKELFEKTALPLVTDLVNGKNGLLFTYGITSSGKTFTIVGTPSEPGILPRSLDILFNTLDKHNIQSRKYVFKPDGANYFEIQSSPDAVLQMQREQKENRNTIPKTPVSTPYGSKTRSAKKKENTEEWDRRVKDDSIIEDVNCGYHYAIFVSYVEIYNNYIYDLLDESLDVFKNTRQPQSKVLREDNRKRVFVSGGSEVEVKTADEAFDLFIKGVRRRRIAHTNLNSESSRSHSVFTIRVVQAPLDADGVEVVQDKSFLVTSQLSIVDLAGSERLGRTKNTGERQREAGNINNSLMALRNCIDILRENQMNGTNKVVPYRDYKLTHLFKSYFEGEGKIKMVICVNPSSEEYDETLHVMKFAEVSQDIMINRGFNRFNRFETVPKYADNLAGIDLAAINVVGPPFPTCYLEEPEDDKVFPEWLECLEQRKRNKESKFETHKQQQLMVRQRIAEMERENMYLKQQLSVMQMDLTAREDQIKEYENKCFQNERLIESHLKRANELDRQLKEYERDIEEKERLLNNSELEKERLKSKMRERLDSERDRLKNIFERILAEKQAQLEKEQCVAKDKMNLVRQILNADNTNLDCFRDYRDILTSNAMLRPSCGPNVPSNGFDSQASTQTPQFMKRRSEFEFGYGTPGATTSSNTPQTVGSVGTDTPHNPPPVVNPRHRRSLSTGNEKWIDHRPHGTLDLGTVLRPKIKNKKSVSNLKASDILKDASKYALTHHEADANGAVETQVFKGEVIPSSSGGVQVIYNDVETLKQGSPPFRKRTVSDTRLLSPHGPSNQVITEAELHHNLPVNTKRSRH